MKMDRLKHKKLNHNSLEVDGIDNRDYPDFVDAFISYGEFIDGEILTDEELDELNYNNQDLVYDLVIRKLF